MQKLRSTILVVLIALFASVNAAQDEVAFDCGTDEEVTINYVGDPYSSVPEAKEVTVERFQELCPNITVEINQDATNVSDLLKFYQTAFAAESSELDVIGLDVFWPSLLAEHLVDLSDIAPKELIDAQAPASIDNNTIDGRLVALPLGVDFGILYYRSDLLSKYGYEAPPATWDELEAMATAIQEGERANGNTEFWGYVWQGNAYEGLTCDALEWHVAETGNNWLTSDGEIMVNTEAAVNAYNRAAGWVGTISPPNVISFQEEDARRLWHAGNAAFMRNWPYAYEFSLNSQDIPEFAVAPLPMGASGKGAATVGGGHFGVPKYSDHPEAAAAFVMYMTGLENQKHIALATLSPPAAVELYNDPEIQEAIPYARPEFVEIVVVRPANIARDKYNDASTLYFKAVHSILTGEQDAKTAMEQLEVDLTDLLEE